MMRKTIVILVAVCLPAFGDFSYEQTAKLTGGMLAGMMKFAGVFSKQAREPMVTTVAVKGDRMLHAGAHQAKEEQVAEPHDTGPRGGCPLSLPPGRANVSKIRPFGVRRGSPLWLSFFATPQFGENAANWPPEQSQSGDSRRTPKPKEPACPGLF